MCPWWQNSVVTADPKKEIKNLWDPTFFRIVQCRSFPSWKMLLFWKILHVSGWIVNIPSNVDHPAHLYQNFLHTMAYEPSLGLFTIHNKIVIPKDARRNVLQCLYVQHTGVVKTWKNVNQMYFWPGMKHEIAQLVGNCQECVSLLPSQPKEPCIQTKAERPFEAISADLGILNGTSYLITVDWYSGWPPVKQLRKLDTSAITGIFENWFYEYGRPLRLRTDNGPQFRIKFDKWCETMGIVHKKSSPIGMWNVL